MNTGKVIAATLKERNLDPMAVPGIVVKNQGLFSCGEGCSGIGLSLIT